MPPKEKASPKKKKPEGKSGTKKASPKKEKPESPKKKPESSPGGKKPGGKKGKKKVPPPPEEDVPPTPASPMQGEEPVVNPNPPQSQVAAFLKSQKAKRAPHVLDKDPRTELPLITPPAMYQATFNAVVGDKDPILLHNFEEVETHNGPLPSEKAILMITDQTLFICTPDGSTLRTMQIDQIQRIDMTPEGDTLAIVGPHSDYDMYLRFLRPGGPAPKANSMKSLHMVYKRMTGGGTVEVRPSLGRPEEYRLDRPIDYQVVFHPQRTKAHLEKALRNFEEQEDEVLRWVEELQNELEAEHRDKMRAKDDQINNILTQLEDTQVAQKAQADEITRLQQIYGTALGQDGEGGDDGLDDLDPKDRRIIELERALRDVKEKADEEAMRQREVDMAGNFFERDLSHEVKTDHTRPRGRSLHMQGLVEVLQKQVRERNRDVDDLGDQLRELDLLRRQLREKDATIQALQSQAEAAGGVGVPHSEFPPPSGYFPDGSGGGGAGPYSAEIDHMFSPEFGNNTGGGFGSNPSGFEPGYSALPDQYGGGGYEPGMSQTVPVDSSPFERQTYQPRMPRSVDEVTKHPITGLQLVNVPPELMRAFSDLKGAAMHMFQQVHQYGKNGKKRPKILILTDKCLYLCGNSGTISKCNTIAEIREIITDDNLNMALKLHPSANDSDLLMEFPTKAFRDEAVRILKIVQQHENTNPDDKAKELHVNALDPRYVDFKKPKGYEVKLRGLTSKQTLYKYMIENEKRKKVQHDQEQDHLEARHNETQHQQQAEQASDTAYHQNVQAAQDAYTRHALEGLKNELRAEFAAKKDAEYQRLKSQIASLEQDNDDKLQELHQVKEQWAGHRCHRQAPRPNIPAKQTEGLFWVPTEPVVLECQLQVLKIQFWDNILITSHANGFLNVWDIDTAECIRTLKDHTAKVIAFQYDGVELVSGSFDSTIRRWNVTDGSCLNVVAAHKGQVTCLQFDRNILISGSSDTTIQVWQMDIELRNLKTLRGHKATVESLRFERDVLVSAEWGWLFVWDLTTGFVIKALRDEQGGITCLDYNNIFMVTGGHAGALTMWDVSTGDYETLYGHTDDITHIQIEGPYAVTSSADCTIRMWDLQNFKSLGIFNNSYPHECSTFQFIANRFVAVEDKTVKIWTK